MRSFHFPGRSPVIARRAMAATSHPIATQVAIDCMKRGGNAVDAAISATAYMCVAEPAMTGIGGDCFALIHKPGTGLIALNGSGRAPQAATAEWYATNGIRSIDVTSPHAVTVPGAIDAWATLLRDHGTMTLAHVLEPAIDAARNGFAIQPRVAHDWAGLMEKIALHPGARQHLTIDGRAPRVGEVMRMPALATTLEHIAREGRDGFYRGPIAADMVEDLRALGGLHTLADFAAQSSSYVTPIAVGYKDVVLHELPPNNQGIVALMALKMLERLGSLGSDPQDPVRAHALIEIARLCYAARDVFVADPDSADVPVEHMLGDRFISTLAGRIDLKRRLPDVGPIPEPTGTDTIYMTCVDQSGLAVSFINSLFAGFGSGIVTRKTGIVLQNRGCGFVTTPGHRNAIGPRKRPLHTLVPAMATRADVPFLSFGVMGGAYQPLGHVQVLSNRLDYDLDIQQAIDLPRIFYEGIDVQVETPVSQRVREALTAMGHRVSERGDPWGGAQAIEFDRTQGTLIGASDPRKDGSAIGY
jgi:gamma-glutamyltranspeptidase/glutathione hydrolase